MVSSVVEDPELAAQRKELTTSKSVSELSQIRSLADFPLPENLERLMSRTATNSADASEPRSVLSCLGKTTPRTGQDRTALVARIEELEDRIGRLETKIVHMENGYVGKAVRFHEYD